LYDADNNLMDVSLNDLSMSVGRSGAAGGATVSPFKRESLGTYQVAVTAGSQLETLKLTPFFQQTELVSANVSIVANVPFDGTSSFSATPTSLTADGTSASTLEFVANNEQGNPVTGIAGQLSFETKSAGGASSGVVVDSVSEAAPGIYRARLTGTKADTWTIRPLLNGAIFGKLQDTVTLVPGRVDVTKSSFSISPVSIPADGTTESVLTFMPKDGQGNPLSGGQVEFSVRDSSGAAAGTNVTIKGLKETAAGTYTAKLSGTKIDTWHVRPAYNKTLFATWEKTVTLTALPPATSTSTFEVSPKTIRADDNQTATFTLTAKDIKNNPLSGLADKLELVILGSDGQPPRAGELTLSSLTENGSTGVYTATLKGNLADEYAVTARFEGTDLKRLSDPLTLTLIERLDYFGVNNDTHRFQPGDGFPKTGFKGASFKIGLLYGTQDKFNWTSSAPWVSVDSAGNVTFIDRGDGSIVTITATQKRGKGSIKYFFILNKWFEPNDGKNKHDKDWAGNQGLGICRSLGMILPAKDDLTIYNGSLPKPGVVGTLWTEWGNLNNYRSDFGVGSLWTSRSDSTTRTAVVTANGIPYNDNAGIMNIGMCMKNF